ncbi:caspase family protein [Falsihalocynthiibacter arcticus]|uniref:Caspase family p20 domain-containing protein n=1 Tax=Falsihalocynthiibacter arcticus TaxID=1579316 RepID=A0A126UYI0_9RHOB|nr:caspase family protein [Falsihalocynthiibacter arcticus]AML50696.1 hypothetical protein RC74_04835 [Falsihalocynthiibacter arcticus]
MRIIIALLISILAITPTVALAGGRVALLIGNSDYSRPDLALPNPKNDVIALAESLRNLGFSVTEVIDQSSQGMQVSLSAFQAEAASAEIALFFYAGHGVQIGGQNYLIGTDIDTINEEDLRRASMTLTQVRDVFEAAAPDIGMLILDACRNNPFADAGQVEKGLVRTKGGAGLLIAYATDPGNVAFDGTGANSVFTSALLKNLATPGLEARLMLGRVRQQVVLETQGQQVPWVEEAVLGEHYFVPASIDAAPKDPNTLEFAEWRRISGSTNPAEFSAYLEQFPDGLFADFARDRVAMLQKSQTISGNSQDLLASADIEQVSAALAALGFYASNDTAQAGITRNLNADIEVAMNAYRSQLALPNDASLEQLFTDAGQGSMFLAATTLQRMRTDIVALRSVDRTRVIAQTALVQITEIALTNPDALPILEIAKKDMQAIEDSRDTILQRLDQSRTYYDEILNRAVLFMPKGATVALIGGEERSRDMGLNNQRLFNDANLFLKHISDANESQKGSYAWLVDVISEG